MLYPLKMPRNVVLSQRDVTDYFRFCLLMTLQRKRELGVDRPIVAERFPRYSDGRSMWDEVSWAKGKGYVSSSVISSSVKPRRTALKITSKGRVYLDRLLRNGIYTHD